jgi:hypothetical protein
MNKQELIEKYKELEKGSFDIGALVVCQLILKDLKQLDEPEKVTIPQFVAEYIEQKKDDDYHLLGAMIEIRSHKNKEIDEWFEEDDNMETFARAWLDGYEVEKEPKYTVKFKATNQYLCDDDGIGLHISPSFRSNFRKSDLEKLSLTEVFDSPLFEVEEV